MVDCVVLSKRGYELDISKKQKQRVIEFVYTHYAIQDSSHYYITLLNQLPRYWNTEQKLLAPMVAEYWYEVTRHLTSEHKDEITLKDIADYKVNQPYLPYFSSLDTDWRYRMIMWSKHVKSFAPVEAVRAIHDMCMDISPKDICDFNYVKDYLKSHDSGHTYSDNAIAQALYQNGFKVKVSVDKALALIQNCLLSLKSIILMSRILYRLCDIYRKVYVLFLIKA